MANMVDVGVDSLKVRAALRAVATRRYPNVIARALNKVAFEVRDAEFAHLAAQLHFAGSSTRRFLVTGSAVVFERATPTRPEVSIHPGGGADFRRKRTALIRSQQDAPRYTARDVEKLELERRGLLAVPKRSSLRGTSGRVSKRMKPSALVAPGGGGFVNRAGTAILRRVGGKRARRVEVVYRLARNAANRQRVDFYATAQKAAQRTFLPKLLRELSREALGR